MKIGRNEPCPCNSGKKYKKCCLDKKDFESETIEEESMEFDLFIDEAIPDYGIPNITESFFDDKFSDKVVPAALQHFRLSNEDVDYLIDKEVYEFISEDRKNSIDEINIIIKETTDPDKLLSLLSKSDLDVINRNPLIEKMLKYSDYIIPKLINGFKTNTDDFFIEFGVELIKKSKKDYLEMIINILPSIKCLYTLSTVCLLLGFIGNKETVKPLWDVYCFLSEKYPNTSLNQGPLYALSELKDRGLI